jgi:hypothetical protein
MQKFSLEVFFLRIRKIQSVSGIVPFYKFIEAAKSDVDSQISNY